MTIEVIGSHISDFGGVNARKTGASAWSPLEICRVPIKAVGPSAPTITSVSAPTNSAGILQIILTLPTTNTDATTLAPAEITKVRLYHSLTSPVTTSDSYSEYSRAETLLWGPDSVSLQYVAALVIDSHGTLSALSNEDSGTAEAAPPAEDSGLWAHRLDKDSVFTDDSPNASSVAWSDVILYWKDNKYTITNGNSDKHYIWWDEDTSHTVFQVTDTAPTLTSDDVLIGYNDSGTWHLMIYSPMINADYLRAGIIQSTNYAADAGSIFNLDDGTFKMGGSSAPKLDWNGTLLSIDGAITIASGSGIANLSDAGDLAVEDDLDGVPDGSTYKRVTANEKSGAGYAYTGLDSSGNLVTKAIPASNVAPSGAGLYLGADYLGYYDSSNWKTYMDNSGNFYLGGTGGALQWNGTTLSITGVVTVSATSSGIASFSDAGDLVTVDEASVNALNLTNAPAEAGADVTSGHTAADTALVNAVAAATVEEGGSKAYSWRHASDVTKIDGGDIYTGSVTATQITVTNLAAINADMGTITAGSMDAARITTGTLVVARTEAKCTDANADQTSANTAADTALVNGVTSSIISGWRYGATTYINGGDIYTNTITAAKINVANLAAISANMGSITAGNITLSATGYIKGGQTAYDTGTGFWLGYSSGYKFSIGAAAGNKMIWDGTNLEVTGKIISSTDSSLLHWVSGVDLDANNIVYDANAPTSYTDLDLSSKVGSQSCLVLLAIWNKGGNYGNYIFRPNGTTYSQPEYANDYPGAFSTRTFTSTIPLNWVWCITDTNGVIEWRSDVANSTAVYCMAYLG